MELLRLTASAGITVCVNPEHIVLIMEKEESNMTVIYLSTHREIEVTDSVPEILDMIDEMTAKGDVF